MAIGDILLMYSGASSVDQSTSLGGAVSSSRFPVNKQWDIDWTDITNGTMPAGVTIVDGEFPATNHDSLFDGYKTVRVEVVEANHVTETYTVRFGAYLNPPLVANFGDVYVEVAPEGINEPVRYYAYSDSYDPYGVTVDIVPAQLVVGVYEFDVRTRGVSTAAALSHMGGYLSPQLPKAKYKSSSKRIEGVIHPVYLQGLPENMLYVDYNIHAEDATTITVKVNMLYETEQSYVLTKGTGVKYIKFRTASGGIAIFEVDTDLLLTRKSYIFYQGHRWYEDDYRWYQFNILPAPVDTLYPPLFAGSIQAERTYYARNTTENSLECKIAASAKSSTTTLSVNNGVNLAPNTLVSLGVVPAGEEVSFTVQLSSTQTSEIVEYFSLASLGVVP